MCPVSDHAPTANYDYAMRAVAYTELIIMARVTLGALTFRSSLISPILYAHFLRQRWYQSKFTREAVTNVHQRINAFVTSPGKPPMLERVYGQFTAMTSRWVGTAMGAPNAAAAGGANGVRRQ